MFRQYGSSAGFFSEKDHRTWCCSANRVSKVSPSHIYTQWLTLVLTITFLYTACKQTPLDMICVFVQLPAGPFKRASVRFCWQSEGDRWRIGIYSNTQPERWHVRNIHTETRLKDISRDTLYYRCTTSTICTWITELCVYKLIPHFISTFQHKLNTSKNVKHTKLKV